MGLAALRPVFEIRAGVLSSSHPIRHQLHTVCFVGGLSPRPAAAGRHTESPAVGELGALTGVGLVPGEFVHGSVSQEVAFLPQLHWEHLCWRLTFTEGSPCLELVGR